MAPVVLRAEQPSDAEAIGALLIDSFPTAGDARLVEALRRSCRLVVSLVAQVMTEQQLGASDRSVG